MLYIGMFLIFVTLQGKNNHVEAAESVINVLDYGACGTDSESDRNAMNEALKAAGMASEGETEVYVPPGVYYIDGYLGIYSGTWLHLSDDAKIVRMEGYETESAFSGQEGYGTESAAPRREDGTARPDVEEQSFPDFSSLLVHLAGRGFSAAEMTQLFRMNP